MTAAATALRVEGRGARRSIAIDIRNLNHAFDLQGSRLEVLQSIDLSVAAGEFVALLGPSGCGKSTLLRLVSCLDRPTAGSIAADGAIIVRPDPSRILVFQDPTLFPWTSVWKNVATGLDARGVLEAKRSEDLSPQGDEFLIISMTRIGKIDAELGLDVCGTIAQNNNPGGEQQGFLDVVRNENRREAFVAPEREKLGLQGQPRQRVELAQRLVQKKQRGIVDERTCERRPLRHAARELMRIGLREGR
jgi:ABC-type sugar transport system ATPase subunit